MAFLNPWALMIGAFALGLPVAIHLLTRPRPRRMPLPTIRFVLQAVAQRRARHRLRDWLLLSVRVLAAAALACAFARPLLGERPLIAADDRGQATRVVVMDVSQSMGAAERGVTPIERARDVAGRVYLAPRAGLRSIVILAGAYPRMALGSATENSGALRRQLADASVRPEEMDVAAAINEAARILAASPQEHRREVVIVSDFQRSNWTAADFGVLPADTKVQLESVAAERVPPNIAVTRVAARGRLEQGRPIQVEVEVANHTEASRRIEVEIELNGARLRAGGLCPPRVCTAVPITFTPVAPGWYAGWARALATADALAADDARPVAFEVAAAPTFAIVTREPARPAPTSSHFVERAISAGGAAREPATAVVRIDAVQIDRELLSAAALIVVDHPGRLLEADIELLAGLVRRGRGLLYVAGEAVDAANLAAMERSLGADWSLPVAFAPPRQERRDLFLVEWRPDAPGLSLFGDSAPAVAAPLRISGGLDTRRLETGLVEDVPAVLSDRSPLLTLSPCGAGAVAVLNADLAGSNIISSPLFVPLLGEVTGRLLVARGGEGARPCGRAMAAVLPSIAAADELTIASDPHVADPGEVIDAGGQLVWRCAEAGPPGIYRVQNGDQTVFALATAVPADEADLAVIDPALLETRLAAGRTVQYRGAAARHAERDDQAWVWAMVTAALCLILELGVLHAFKG